MDRFDDMRAKNSKPKLQSKIATPSTSDLSVTPDADYDGLSQVTVNGDSNLVSSNIKSGVNIFGVDGSYSGSSGGSGSSGYNVFVQQSEPTEKNGVWIKSSGGSGATKFYEYATATGEFLEASKFNFLKTTETTVAQQIVDGWMYIIASTPSASYKVNLETQVSVSINTPTFSNVFTPFGSVIYKDKIYIFGSDSYKVDCYIYDPTTDTSSIVNAITTTNSSVNYTYGCYEYDGKIFMAHGSYNYPYYLIYDIENMKVILSEAELSSKNYGTSAISGYGKNVFYFSGNTNGTDTLYKYDMTTYTKTALKTFNEMKMPFATSENIIYLFNSSTSGSNEYYRYNLESDELETITTENKYYLYTLHYDINSIINSLMLDDQSGILYFRTSKGNAQPSAMQFTPSPKIDELSTGTAVIIQSQHKNITKIENNSNIHTGVENAYLKTSDDLVSQLTLLGSGESWRVIKNLNSETATVTFNSNGGTSVDSVEVVIGQKLLTKPETTRSDNYVFDAWYLGDEPYNFGNEIIKDITLTAHWLAYEEVDYIESTGTQYIDTGVKGSIKNRIELDLQYTGNVGIFQINGLLDANSMRNEIGLNGSYVFWGVSTNSVTSETAADNERHTYFIDCTDGSYGMDGLIIGSVTPATVDDTTLNVLLGARKKTTGVEGFCYERIFGGKYYIDGTLVRNFQPIQIETGEYALVDKVNNKVYRNAGTGEFIAGEEV